MDETAGTIARSVEAAPRGLSTDEALDVLSDRRRRHLLTTLHQVETPERLSSLTRSLAVAEDWSGDDVKRLHVRLHHCHVPKLEAAGIVSYDADDGTVDLTERGQALAAELGR